MSWHITSANPGRAPKGVVSMPSKITRDVLESYLHCKHKGWLKSHQDKEGQKSH